MIGPGSELGGFAIESIAGRGGMGVVYRARQRLPDRIVALKVISGEYADDPQFRTRFEREATIAAQIEHPNVIPEHVYLSDFGLARHVVGSHGLTGTGPSSARSTTWLPSRRAATVWTRARTSTPSVASCFRR